MIITNENGNSDWLETNLGIPQGSVLGSLLFCIYVNDLRDILDGRTIKHIFYAHDLQIYLHTTKDKILEGISRAIVFGSKKNVNDINSLGLPGIGMQNGVLIPFSSEVVSLGVTLDSKLTWKPQVDEVTKKVNKDFYSLRFIRACITKTLRMRLVESLVQPHLDYCTVVYLDATNEQRTRLDRLSSTGVRYIFGVKRDAHITPYWRRLGWLRSVSQIIFYSSITIQNQTYASAHLFG